MRNLCASFIFASAFAYLAGVWLVFLGYPPILNMPLNLQALVFVIMAVAGFIASRAINDSWMENFRTLLAVIWGAMAAFTFVGYVQWAPDGSAPYQLFMTIWDLALAICVLDE